MILDLEDQEVGFCNVTLSEMNGSHHCFIMFLEWWWCRTYWTTTQCADWDASTCSYFSWVRQTEVNRSVNCRIFSSTVGWTLWQLY